MSTSKPAQQNTVNSSSAFLPRSETHFGINFTQMKVDCVTKIEESKIVEGS